MVETGIDWENVKFYLEQQPFVKDDGMFADGGMMRSTLLGTVFDLMPSGKYYMPWCSNFTDEEAEIDEEMMQQLGLEAQERGYFLMEGEGDPCDIFVCENLKCPRCHFDMTITEDEDKNTKHRDVVAVCGNPDCDYYLTLPNPDYKPENEPDDPIPFLDYLASQDKDIGDY